MKFPFLFFCIVFYSSCSNNATSETPNISATNKIQTKVDSVSYLYDLALSDLQRGDNNTYIVNKYGGRIRALRESIKTTLDSVTNQYMARQFSENKYQKFIKSLQMDSVQTKMERLHKAGVIIPM